MTIPMLDDTMGLAKSRIFATGEQVAISAERLTELSLSFSPQNQKGILGYFRRRRAVKAYHNLLKMFQLAEKYHTDFHIAKNKNDPWSIQKPTLAYLIELAIAKEDFIKAFSYDYNKRTYSRKYAEEKWKWMLNGLLIPELKSLGD